jgi:replicative DNA helicase
MKEAALKLLNCGLSVIPTKDQKQPALDWQDFQKKALTAQELEELFSGKKIRLEIEKEKTNKKTGEKFTIKGIQLYPKNATIEGLAIICGAVSGGLEVIDVDCKYDLTGRLWEEYSKLLKDNLEDYNSLVIAVTKNGGYHIYYRCSKYEKNLKLAERPTTEEEKKQTYKKEISTGATEEEAKKRAENDNTRVLIETRGEGGYIIAPPSEGYKYIQGNIDTIPTITEEQREIIIEIARTFDQQKEEAPVVTPTPTQSKIVKKEKTGLQVLDDYNQRAGSKTLELLISHGWKKVEEDKERVYLLRPGETKAKHSGNWHKEKETLFVFSSSSDFAHEKGLSPVDVFMTLNKIQDPKEAVRQLAALGYGDVEYKKKAPTREPIRLTGSKDILLTEGVVEGVEALILPLTEEAIKKAIEGGAGSFTIAASEEQTDKALDALINYGVNSVYIVTGAPTTQNIKQALPFYLYRLNNILDHYDKIEQLSYKDVDSLKTDIVKLAASLAPLDREAYKKEAINIFKGLGLTEEAYSITVDKITATAEREAQKELFSNMIAAAEKKSKEGETAQAIELIQDRLQIIKLRDKATEFTKLLTTTTEEAMRAEEQALPSSIDSGYIVNKEELLLPSGAITVYAAPTNHGKTILLINTVLNVAEKYPSKKFIFFTYEERSTAILQYFLNTYIDIDLNDSNKTNRRLIKEYFKTGSTEYIKNSRLADFEERKREFFTKYIETGRILVKYVDYNSQELNSAIEYLHKEEPNIGGVFIDYFQLLRLAKEKNSRQEELKQICISLKDTAVKTGLPLVLAAQFNREVTNLMRLHPTNIGEAGDIERIVNTLVGLWNMNKKPVLKGITEAEVDEINNRLTKRGINTEGEGNMYIEILKSRDLATGSYEFLNFNGNTGKLKNASERGAFIDTLDNIF